MTTIKMFEKHKDEFLEFDRIPHTDRLHPCLDLCGMLYLYKIMKKKPKRNMVACAEHDEFFIEGDAEGQMLTNDDVIYLTRCGVRLSDSGFCMFA